MPVSPPTIDRFEDLEIYSFPFRGINIAVLILFTLSYTWIETVFRGMGISGLIITMLFTYVCSLLFFGYLFVILQDTARGHQHIEQLSASLLEQARLPLFKEVLLLSFLAGLVYLIPHPFWKVTTAILMVLVVPMATSHLVLTGRLTTAMNPLAWIGMIGRIETPRLLIEYLVLQTALAAACYHIASVDLGWLNFARITVVLALFMLVFRSLGVLLHANGDALGLPVKRSKRIEEEQLADANDKRISDFVFHLYQLAHSGQSAAAWQQLQQQLEADKYESEALYFAKLRAWDKPQLAIKAGQEYIRRLAQRNDLRTAWDVLEFCYNANGNEYQLTSGAAVLKLVDHADTFLRKEILVHLLAHFDTDFPGHPRAGEALLTAARLSAHDLNDFEGATALLERIRTNFSAVSASKEFRTLEAVLKAT